MSPDDSHRNGGSRDRRNGPQGRRPFSKEPNGKRDSDRKGNGNRSFDRRGPSDRKGPRRDDRNHDRVLRNGNRGERREFRPREPSKPRSMISDDPQKLLFKGVDLQAKGNDDRAMIMFLHGSVLMSKGCENNALRILDSHKEEFSELRSRIAEECSEDALVEYDYLCQIIDPNYDITFFKSKFDEKNIHAIYRMICMGKVEGEDDIIDTFTKSNDDAKVLDGLKYLVKKKDSKKAESFIRNIDEKKERKQQVHVAFTKAMKGETKYKRDLEKLSKEFPEAAFFLGYVKAREEGNAIPWLKEKYPQFQDLIISEEFNLRIGDTDYGMYLRAMKIKSKKEDWVPSMIKAAKYGSQEAMEELKPLMHRTEMKKAIANIHLTNGDFQGLVEDYVNGLDEVFYLDKYCESDPQKIVEAGRRIGEISPEREIDWLRAHAFMPECREALTVRAEDEKYHSRELIYALHDVGKDIEAADLYFAMEGHPDLPAVKWLAKVCRNEDAKEYVRSHFESKGDLETFEYIFVDDGYKKKSKGSFRRR